MTKNEALMEDLLTLLILKGAYIHGDAKTKEEKARAYAKRIAAVLSKPESAQGA